MFRSQVFASKMWGKMKAKVANNAGGSFEPALVWTEIKSYIKGSVEALKAHEEADDRGESVPLRQKRLKEAYLALGRKVFFFFFLLCAAGPYGNAESLSTVGSLFLFLGNLPTPTTCSA
jgi:hypothetical protein